MLDTGSTCPRCGSGTIVLVSKYRRAPNKTYSAREVAGPIRAAQRRFRCSEGCAWIEKEDPRPRARLLVVLRQPLQERDTKPSRTEDG